MAPSLENWTSARPEVAGSEDIWLARGGKSRRAGAGPPETNCGVKSRGTIVSDNLLSTQDRQEALSRAYASAVAAGAGYVTYIPDFNVFPALKDGDFHRWRATVPPRQITG